MNHFTFVKVNGMCYTAHIHCSIVYYTEMNVVIHLNPALPLAAPPSRREFFDQA